MSRQAVQVHPRREDVGDGSNESKKPQQPRISSAFGSGVRPLMVERSLRSTLIGMMT